MTESGIRSSLNRASVKKILGNVDVTVTRSPNDRIPYRIMTERTKENSMGSDLKPLPDIARNAGATVDQLRYWLRILEIKVTKQGKTRMVSEESANQLSSMAKLVKDGMSPKDAATHILSTPLPPAATSENRELSLVSEMSELKNVLVMMAETMSTMKAEMARLIEDNRALRQESASIHALILPPRRSAPWSPPPSEKRVAVQRELSIIEAVRGYFDDCLGFILGRG